MKHYTNPAGDYFAEGYGSFSEGNPSIPSDAVEVPSTPVSPGQTWDGTAWSYTKPALLAHLANYRWLKEQGGITWNGVPIRTDDRSQGLLSGIQTKIDREAAPTKTRRIKTVIGFQDLTNAMLSAIYEDVADHVQKCFDSEDATIPGIDDGTLTTPESVESAFDASYAT